MKDLFQEEKYPILTRMDQNIVQQIIFTNQF